jgi:hypothetical protein
LLILLQLRIGGINTASGAFFGAIFFALFQLFGAHHVKFPGTHIAVLDAQYLLVAVGAFVISRDPNGLGGHIAELGEKLRGAWTSRQGTSDSTHAETPEPELAHV